MILATTPTVVFAEGRVVVALNVAVAISESVSVKHLTNFGLVVEVLRVSTGVPFGPASSRELAARACLGAAVTAVPLTLRRVKGALILTDPIADLARVSGACVRVLTVFPRRTLALARHACFFILHVSLQQSPPSQPHLFIHEVSIA